MLRNNINFCAFRDMSIFPLLCFLLLFSIYELVPTSADYNEYLKYYNGFGGERFGIGFKLLMDFFKFVNFSSLLVVWFFIALMTMSIKLYIVYRIKNNNVLLFFILYGSSYFFLHESVQLRACLGLTFSILAVYLFSCSKYFFGITALITAVFFHSSCLVFLGVLPVIFCIKKNILLYGYFIVISFCIYIFYFIDLTMLAVFNPLVMDYVNYAELTKFSLLSVSLILAYGFIIFGMLNYKNTNLFGKIIFNFYILLIGMVIALSTVPVIAIRVGDIMNLLPYFYIITFDKSLKLRYLFLLIMIAIMTLHKFIAFIFMFPIFHVNIS